MAIQFPPPSVEQFFRTFRIGTFAVDKEETRLIFSSNMDGKVNLWAMDFERLYPYPLTTEIPSTQIAATISQGFIWALLRDRYDARHRGGWPALG